MGSFKIIIKENNVPDNAEAIGKNTKFTGIAEMAIDIHLFRVRRRGEILSEADKKRSIGDFGEATETRSSLERERRMISKESVGIGIFF